MAERVVKTRLTVQVSDYEKGMLAAANATRTVGTEAEKLAQKKQAFEQLGRGLVVTGAALTAVTALSVKAALDWESAWAGVTKTVDGTDAEMAQLEEGLRGLASTLPATHREIAAVAEAAGQLGVRREDIVAFTKTMVDLGETTNLTADEAATSIAQLTNIMQTAPEDVDNLGAALVALGNDGASTERDIVQMAQRIAGAGRTVGLSESEVLGFANALASVGIEAEAGGSAISRIMTDIAMSVSAGGEELDQFAKVAGVSSEAFAKSFKDDPADAIATFVEGLARIDAEGGDVFATLSDLGQSDVRVSQALLGMANSGDLLRKSLELGGVAWKENTALAVEAAKRYETTEARIQIAGNAVRDAAIDFGEVFLPAVGAAADGLAEFAGFLGDLPDPVQGIMGVLTSVVGVIALTGGAALLAVPKIAEFKVVLQTLGISMRSVALVGGGAILALTALVTVVGLVSSAQAEAQQKAQSYADTLAEGTNKVTKATRDMAKEALAAKNSFLWMEQDSAFDAAEKLGISFDLVTDAATGNVAAMKELQKQIDEGADGSLAYANSAVDIETAVRGEADSLERAIELAEQKQRADGNSAESSGTAAEAYLEESGAVEDLNTQLSSLIDTINEANGVNQDAVSANANYQSALAGISDEVQKQRDAYEEANGTLDGFKASLDENTASGSANAAMLSDVAGRAQDAAAAQFEVDKQTMSSKDAADKYYGTLQAQRQAFIDSATAAGFNADEVNALADEVFALPSKKDIEVVANTDTAEDKLRRLRDTLSSIPGYRSVTLETIEIGNRTATANFQGGMYTDGVKHFASGGFASGIYAGVMGGIRDRDRIFAEKDMGVPWETYISGRAQDRNRNIGIWQQTGQMLGVGGGSSSSPSAPLAVYVQNPFTGEYLLAKVSSVASSHVKAYDDHEIRATRGGVRF